MAVAGNGKRQLRPHGNTAKPDEPIGTSAPLRTVFPFSFPMPPAKRESMEPAGQQLLLFDESAPAADVGQGLAPSALAPKAVSQKTPLVTLPEVVLRRSPRARHYRLAVRRDGAAVLTIPARGSEREARRFLATQFAWLERTRERMRRLPRAPQHWLVGTTVLHRGEWREILRAPGEPPRVTLGADVYRVRRLDGDLRPTLEAHFRRQAAVEIVARTWELAARHGADVKHVAIRNQRTRWGSCSASGSISLNWRLLQAPAFVADYIVIHELMHLREMNHSPRFWAQVARACPEWERAEQWLKRHGSVLGL
jgi:predicted metal-dependent hydrolase